ncbi:hypothetical protein VN24_13250 [Paenibacillus beijingensis]|uniref:Uncharacterized protein n=1 Tax=Paenibacillus beijingensis TaxID=1126833 RepID=A0A0D5NRD4_9BACL|nr:hypothetical protein VN24_13250 [Paenibacillus beijingensis]
MSSGAGWAVPAMKWMARTFALFIAAQVFLAGLAMFVDSDWTAHANFARFFIIIPILMMLVSFIARLPVSYRVKSIQLLVMVILMFVTADLSSVIGFLSALHPVLSLAMFWITLAIARQAAAQTTK